MSASTASGCWQGNPCAYDSYSWSSNQGRNFVNVNEYIQCGGTTACVSNVGISTYGATTTCQGAVQVYCGSSLMGTINTVGALCTGSSVMSNPAQCKISFSPTMCPYIRLVGVSGNGGGCCGSAQLDMMITAVTAW